MSPKFDIKNKLSFNSLTNNKINLKSDIYSSNDNQYQNFSFLLKETRVKKFDQYRQKIKKEFDDFYKNNLNYDFIRTIEKKIKKINHNLIIDDEEQRSEIFMNLVINDTSNLSYIDEAKTSVTKIKSCDFKNIIGQIDNINNQIQQDPTFDKEGNLSLNWLNNDPIYNQLKEMNEWINKTTKNHSMIESKLEKKIFNFRESLRLTKNSYKYLLPSSAHQEKIYKTKKMKKIFYFIFSLFVLVFVIFVIFLSFYLIGGK